MRVRIYVTVSKQAIYELIILYLYNESNPTKSRFMNYMRSQLEMFGIEHCGLGENGTDGYEDFIPMAKIKFKKWFGSLDGVETKFGFRSS